MRIIFKFSIWAISVAITLLGMEMYLRANSAFIVRQSDSSHTVLIQSDPFLLVRLTDKGRRLVPNAKVTIKNHYLSEQDIHINTNSLGLRAAEIDKTHVGETRILVLGDSITLADYLPAEDTYVSSIHRNLDMENLTVINGGLSNVGLLEELDLLEEIVEKIRPNIVLFGFYLNDSRPAWGFISKMGRLVWWRSNFLIVDAIYRYFLFQNFLDESPEKPLRWVEYKDKLNWKSDPQQFKELIEHAKYDWGAGWLAESWKTINNQLERADSLSKKYGFKIGILAFPVSFQVYADFVDDYPQKKLQELSNNFGFPVYDLLPLLRQYRNQEIFYDQCHTKADTNHLIGTAAAQWLKTTLMK